MENVSNIGSRLGLNMIVVGSVGKKDTVIILNSKVIHIEQKRVIFENQTRALGDAGLISEVKNLSASIISAISIMHRNRRIGKGLPRRGPSMCRSGRATNGCV